MNDLFRSYLLLGVKPGASLEEIKRAYRQLARQWHPDRLQNDERRRGLAEERLREINCAYEILQSARAVSGETGRGMQPRGRPADPGYDTYEWTRKAAEQVSADTRAEDDQAFYERALSLHFEGMQHFRSARWREAVSCLLQSVCLVQDNPEAYRTLGRAYRRLGQPAKAASAYQQAIRIEPRSTDAYYELGEVYLLLGDLEGARRQASVLQEIDGELAALLHGSITRAAGRPRS